MRTRIKNVRVVLHGLLAAGAIAPAPAPPVAGTGISHHNVGDINADNGGGPSDGDGKL